MSYVTEMNAKPLGFILPTEDEKAEFAALSLAQRGYFLHWVRSNAGNPNKRLWWTDWWSKAMRKAREQRP